MKATRVFGWSALVLAAILTSACKDTILSDIEETVRTAELPDRTLTILAPATGSVTPVGAIVLKENEPLAISASAPGGYSFVNWEKIAGAGTVTFANPDAAATVVTLSGGDATIQPVISNALRTLTVNNDTRGTTSPAGAVSVADGVARSISATATTAGYEFDTWMQTGGAGAVAFGSAASASTTVTVTGNDATIEARFKLKVYTVAVINDGHGTTNPSGDLSLTHGVASASITATPDTAGGYQFAGWQTTSGAGIAYSPGAASNPVQVTATGGNATVRANFSLRTYSVTISSANVNAGYVSPSGAPRSPTASPSSSTPTPTRPTSSTAGPRLAGRRTWSFPTRRTRPRRSR